MSDLWRDTMVAGFRDAVMQILLVLPRLLALLTFLSLDCHGMACQSADGARPYGLSLRSSLRAVRARSALAQAGIKQPVSVVLVGLVLDGVPALCVHGCGRGESSGHGQSHQPDCGFSAQCACGRVGITRRRTVRKFLCGGGVDRGGERATARGTHRGEPGSVGDSLFTFAMVLTQLGIAKEIVISAFSITFGGVVFRSPLAWVSAFDI